MPSLPMVVVLPTPLTPTNSQTLVAPASRCSSRSPCEGGHQLGLERVDQLLGRSIPSCLTRARRSSRSRVGQPGADVGQDQRLLELVPGGAVDPVRGSGPSRGSRRRATEPGPGGPGSGARASAPPAPRRLAAAPRRPRRFEGSRLDGTPRRRRRPRTGASAQPAPRRSRPAGSPVGASADRPAPRLPPAA